MNHSLFIFLLFTNAAAFFLIMAAAMPYCAFQDVWH